MTDSSGRTSLRVVLVDDQPDILAWAETTLTATKWLEVVGRTTSPEEALTLLVDTGADLLIADFEMPGLTGFELTRRAKEVRPDVQVVLMSMHESTYFEVLARLAGALGFISKSRLSIEAVAALLNVPAEIAKPAGH